MLEFEQKHWISGKKFIAGIDEAGRGPLAGPVVSSAVILPQDVKLPEVYDSKKWFKMTVCVPSEYVPKLSYPIKIDGSILFGINKKLILKIFS